MGDPAAKHGGGAYPNSRAERGACGITETPMVPVQPVSPSESAKYIVPEVVRMETSCGLHRIDLRAKAIRQETPVAMANQTKWFRLFQGRSCPLAVTPVPSSCRRPVAPDPRCAILKSVDSSDLTVEILREIRDQTRETNARLDQTNVRIDQTADRLDSRMDELGRRIVDSEIRTATAIAGLNGTLTDIKELLSD